MAQPKSTESYSFAGFWLRGFILAVKSSWNKYGNAALFGAVTYAVVGFFFAKWMAVQFPGKDMNFMITIAIPAGIFALALVYHLARAPYEIYLKQCATSDIAAAAYPKNQPARPTQAFRLSA